MLKLEHTEVVGWEAAIRGMRNPLESWERGDTYRGCKKDCDMCLEYPGSSECLLESRELIVGPNDHDLMTRLRNAGTDHRKFMRFITVYVDITAPLYWWKEFDTYKVGTVANSCSTMHKIAAKEFTLGDFSCEHLFNEPEFDYFGRNAFSSLIGDLNKARDKYLETKDKKYWWQMIQLLPSSYNQKRTVMLNYEVLANIYKSRRNHKLDEWHTLCDWIEGLPYSEIITGMSESEKILRIGEKLHEGFEKGLENPDPTITSSFAKWATEMGERYFGTDDKE